MAKQKYERGKLSLRGTKAVQPEVQTERAVEELMKLIDSKINDISPPSYSSPAKGK